MPGMAVSISEDATVVAARANDQHSNVVAFAAGTIAPGAVGAYQAAGVLDAFADLIPGQTYFLASEPGAITTAPGADSRMVQAVGVGLSKTALLIWIGEAIRVD